MSTPRFAIVPTALGAFGAAWNDHGIVRTWLHNQTEARTRRQILRRFPNALEAPPPDKIASTMLDVAALLSGNRTPNADVALDTRGLPEFDRRVYDVARTIPAGETMTYGAIAKALGEEPMMARDVGAVMARNPFAPIVPCHRVVAAAGLGGYSAPGGTATKRRLLELEGAAIVAHASEQPGLFDEL